MRTTAGGLRKTSKRAVEPVDCGAELIEKGKRRHSTRAK